MRALGEGSVSLVLTDPPYFMDGMDDGWSHETLRRRRDRCNGAVGGLPGGMKFDPAQGRRLQAFLAPIAAEWMRVVKPGGFVLCFSQPRLVHRMAVAIEDAGFEVRDLYVWRYGDGQCKAFSQDHFIRRMDIPEGEKARLIGELGGRKTPQLKPQMETVVMAQAPREGTYAENWLAHRVGLVDMSADNNLLEAGRVPGTIMPARKPREKYGHMTVKPVDLLRHLYTAVYRHGRSGSRSLCGYRLDGCGREARGARVHGVRDRSRHERYGQCPHGRDGMPGAVLNADAAGAAAVSGGIGNSSAAGCRDSKPTRGSGSPCFAGRIEA